MPKMIIFFSCNVCLFVIFLRVLQVHGHDGWYCEPPPLTSPSQGPITASNNPANYVTEITMVMETLIVQDPLLPVTDLEYQELSCPKSTRDGQLWTQLQPDTGLTTASVAKDDLLPNGFTWDELNGPNFVTQYVQVEESSDSASYLFPRGTTVVSFSSRADSGKIQTCTFYIYVNRIALINAKSTSLLISWVPYQPASEYYIKYHPDYSDHDIEVEHMPSVLSRVELTHLVPNTKYIVAIEAKNSSSSVCTVDMAEIRTLPASAYSRRNVALIIICCILAVLVIVLLILLIIFCCFKRRRQVIIDDTANGRVNSTGIEHRNPGYIADDNEKPKRPLSETSHAFIYISPESSPKEGTNEFFVDPKKETF